MRKAKKFLLILTFVFMFLIGNLSVKAFECEYENGNVFYFEYNSQTKKYTRVTKDASFKIDLSKDTNDINIKGANIITKLNEACSKGNLGCSGTISTINWKKSEYGYVAYDTVKQGYCPAYMVILMPKLSNEYDSKNNPYSILGKSNLALYFAPNEAFMNKLKQGNDKVEVVYGEIKNQPNHKEESKVKGTPTSCLDFDFEGVYVDDTGDNKITKTNNCTDNQFFACVWVDKQTGKTSDHRSGGYCNTDNLQYVKCGDSYDIPRELPRITSFFITLIRIVAPLILIVVSIITLIKAMASGEDSIKKAQKSLINKMIAAVMIFFMITIVKFVVVKVADSADKGSIGECMSCFINNKCSSVYYKTNVLGSNVCHYTDGTELDCNSK